MIKYDRYLCDFADEELEPMHLSAGSRSKTLPPGPSMSRRLSSINLDRLKNAKITAEKAIKVKASIIVVVTLYVLKNHIGSPV